MNLSISIHAPREGSDVEGKARATERLISIHAPREGGDCGFLKSPVYSLIFQSTPPARGATSRQFIKQADYFTFQSTPPARGGDPVLLSHLWDSYKFQSTPPARGATRAASCRLARALDFNPRPPRGGATLRVGDVLSLTPISIHAPREGGDLYNEEGGES